MNVKLFTGFLVAGLLTGSMAIAGDTGAATEKNDMMNTGKKNDMNTMNTGKKTHKHSEKKCDCSECHNHDAKEEMKK